MPSKCIKKMNRQKAKKWKKKKKETKKRKVDKPFKLKVNKFSVWVIWSLKRSIKRAELSVRGQGENEEKRGICWIEKYRIKRQKRMIINCCLVVCELICSEKRARQRTEQLIGQCKQDGEIMELEAANRECENSEELKKLNSAVKDHFFHLFLARRMTSENRSKSGSMPSEAKNQCTNKTKKNEKKEEEEREKKGKKRRRKERKKWSA